MLSKENYKTLLPFRNATVKRDSPSERMEFLLKYDPPLIKAVGISVENYCDITQVIDSEWAITVDGLDALEEFEEYSAQQKQKQSENKAREAIRLQERHEDFANEERRYRTQNKIAIIMPFVTFFLGMIVEHFTSAVAVMLSFFI